MYKGKKIICVIPARLASTRFPEKILASLCGKPLIQRVFEAATKCSCFDKVIIALDDDKTALVVKEFTDQFMMTPPSCQNGTERLSYVKNRLGPIGDIWVNWQADEPFIDESIIHALLSNLDGGASIWTLKRKITDEAELLNSNIVKVVTDKNDNALYFSRSLIPFNRDRKLANIYYKHIGLYAYSTEALSLIEGFESCEIELTESLEQLRFLYHGLKIQVATSPYETIGIDRKEDLEKSTIEFLNRYKTPLVGNAQ